jgi:hypothetical protein
MATTYEKIASTTLGSATNTITFSSIPSSFTDIRLVLSAGFSTTGAALIMRFNNDSTSIYSFTSLYGNGSTASSYRETNNNGIPLEMNFGLPNTQWSLWTADIFSYTGSTFKTALTTGSTDNNGSGIVYREVGLYRSTSVINRLDLVMGGVNFLTGTTATLYGILKA